MNTLTNLSVACNLEFLLLEEPSFSRRVLLQGVIIGSLALGATGNMSYAWVPPFFGGGAFFFRK